MSQRTKSLIKGLKNNHLNQHKIKKWLEMI